jgi:hypothetical protein
MVDRALARQPEIPLVREKRGIEGSPWDSGPSRLDPFGRY